MITASITIPSVAALPATVTLPKKIWEGCGAACVKFAEVTSHANTANESSVSKKGMGD